MEKTSFQNIWLKNIKPLYTTNLYYNIRGKKWKKKRLDNQKRQS